MINLTIITPTFNRFHTLAKLHDSLKCQTYKNFEWLIIDDGSTDSTMDLIRSFQESNNGFPITCINKTNGGKHTALNVAFEIVQTDWLCIVDSDDWLDHDCVEIIVNKLNSLNSNVGCLITHRKYPNGKINGDIFKEGEHSYLIRAYNRIHGDKFEVFRSSILNEFRFPVFDGEKFMSESPLHMYIGRVTRTYFHNYAGYIGDYLEQGLTQNSVSNRHKCNNSTLYVYYNRYGTLKYSIPKLMSAVNWWRFKFSSKKKLNSIRQKVPFIYAPLGFILYLFDLSKK